MRAVLGTGGRMGGVGINHDFCACSLWLESAQRMYPCDGDGMCVVMTDEGTSALDEETQFQVCKSAGWAHGVEKN